MKKILIFIFILLISSQLVLSKGHESPEYEKGCSDAKAGIDNNPYPESNMRDDPIAAGKYLDYLVGNQQCETDSISESYEFTEDEVESFTTDQIQAVAGVAAVLHAIRGEGYNNNPATDLGLVFGSPLYNAYIRAYDENWNNMEYRHQQNWSD